MVSLWFWHGTELSMMIEALKNKRKVLTDKHYRVNGEVVRVNLALIFLECIWEKRRPVFNKALSEASGDKGKSLAILEEDSIFFSRSHT